MTINHFLQRWSSTCAIAIVIALSCGSSSSLAESKFKTGNDTSKESMDLTAFLSDGRELFISLKDALSSLVGTVIQGNVLKINVDALLFLLTHPSRIIAEPIPALVSVVGNLDMLRSAVVNSVMDKAFCSLCHAGFRMLKLLIKLNFSEQLLGSIIGLGYYVGKQYSMESCVKVGRMHAHNFYTILSKSTARFDEMCYLLVPYGCESQKSMAWSVPLPEKTKPPVVAVPLPPEGAPTLKYVVISDPHLDLYYEPGSYVPCAEMLCCQNSSTKISTSNQAGLWGDYRECDINIVAFQSLLDSIKKEHSDAAGVFWLGDSISHNLWNDKGVDDHINLMEVGLRTVNDTLGMPIYPTLGNHDSFPVNSYIPSDLQVNDSMDYFYNETYKIWKNYLPVETKDTILETGSYTTLLKPGLRLIAFNNNYAYNRNFWLLLNPSDFGGLLAWLAEELQKAEDKLEKVIIMIHIPPCSEEVISEWSANYHKIVNRYNMTVVAQLSGHTHYDQFCIFHDENKHTTATSIIYICPSATSYDHMNMAYRIITLDGDRPNTTYNVLDHETWYMDLDEANKVGLPNWKKEYSAKESYRLPDLRPQSWQNLVNSMKNGSNRDAIDKYKQYYTRLVPLENGCDAVCEKDLICHMEMGRSRNRTECDVGFMY